MKVTKVEVLRASRFNYVKVQADEGLEGIGELHPASGPGMPLTPLAAVAYCGEYLVGKEPRHIERHWQHMFRPYLFRGGPAAMAAIGAIDMALWDIKGEAAGLPVYSLLGGPTRERVRLYTHLGGNSPQELADHARAYVEAGFTAVRLYPFGDFGAGSFAEGQGLENMSFRGLVRNAVARVEAVREAVGPEVDVMVATSAVEREFRQINRRTEVGARWTDEGVERVARLLEEVRLNGTRLEF